MKISITELVYINEAAKALKSSKVLLYNNILVGLDNINNIIIYTKLDPTFITVTTPLMFNQRDLSSFVNSAKESEFVVDGTGCIKTDYPPATKTAKTCINILPPNTVETNNIISIAVDKINFSNFIQCTYNHICDDYESNDIRDKVYSMNSSNYSYITLFNKYILTIFPSIIPINKTDRVLVSIYQNDLSTFVTKYSIVKKKFIVNVLVRYLFV